MKLLYRIVYWPWLRRYERLEIVSIVGWRTVRLEAFGVPRIKVTFCFGPFQ